jgi:hypothetical protein
MDQHGWRSEFPDHFSASNIYLTRRLPKCVGADTAFRRTDTQIFYSYTERFFLSLCQEHLSAALNKIRYGPPAQLLRITPASNRPWTFMYGKQKDLYSFDTKITTLFQLQIYMAPEHMQRWSWIVWKDLEEGGRGLSRHCLWEAVAIPPVQLWMSLWDPPGCRSR